MCCFYMYEDGNKYRPFVPASGALRARARQVEAGMGGEPVPEDAWELFFSPACGAIEWRYFERMFQARKTAVIYLSMQAPSRRTRRASAFRAVEISDTALQEA